MLPLRYPWVWLAFGWLFVAGVCIGSLLPGGALPSFILTDKAVHAAAYLLLMVWFSGIYERRRHGGIAIVLVLLGFGLDLAQSQVTSRRFDMLDVAANTAGIAAGFVLARVLVGGWCQRIERLLPA